MSSHHQRNGIWDGENKPGSLTEWFAGRNLKGKAKPTPKDESGEFSGAQFAAIYLAKLAESEKDKLKTPATTTATTTTTTTAKASSTASASAVARDGLTPANQHTSGRVKPTIVNINVSNSNAPSSNASSSSASKQGPKAHPVGCTAKAGANPLSLGNCTCSNCEEDRSAAEKALRKSRLEREIKALEADLAAKKEAKTQSAEAPAAHAAPVTPTAPKTRQPRRRSSFSTTFTKFASAFDSDDDSYTEETITTVEYEHRNFETPKKKKGHCTTCGHTCRPEQHHDCQATVEQDAGARTPKPAAAPNTDQYHDFFTAAQEQAPVPSFVPQHYPANGGSQYGFPVPPYAHYGVARPAQPGPSYPPPGMHNADNYGQGPSRTDRPGPHPYQAYLTVPPRDGMQQGRSKTPDQPRGRPPPSPEPMPRSAMRGSRERERSRSMPPRAPTPPTMPRAATSPVERWAPAPNVLDPPMMSGPAKPPADHWFPAPNILDPPMMSGPAKQPGNRWNQGHSNGRPRNLSGVTSNVSQQQLNQTNGRFTNDRQGNCGNSKFNVGSHRDLDYSPGYSAPASNWKDPETDLNGLHRSGNQHTQQFDGESATRFDVPGAWYSASESGSSVSWEQTGFDYEYRQWQRRWDAPPQRVKPDTSGIEHQVSNLMISLPDWANVEAERAKRGPGWFDEQGGRRAPPDVKW